MIALLSELASTGIADLATIVIVLLVVRYWLSEIRSEFRQEMQANANELRQEMQANTNQLRQEMQANTDQLRQEMQANTDQLRQEIGDVKETSEQGHKETLLHTIDVRERLANIEGRLGLPPSRQGIVPPVPMPGAPPESSDPA